MQNKSAAAVLLVGAFGALGLFAAARARAKGPRHLTRDEVAAFFGQQHPSLIEPALAVVDAGKAGDVDAQVAAMRRFGEALSRALEPAEAEQLLNEFLAFYRSKQ